MAVPLETGMFQKDKKKCIFFYFVFRVASHLAENCGGQRWMERERGKLTKINVTERENECDELRQKEKE